MSKRATKAKQNPSPEGGAEPSRLTLVEFPATPGTPALNAAEAAAAEIVLDYRSMGYAEYERGSLLRLFRSEFRNYVKFLMTERGGRLSLEDACHQASVRYDEKGAAELMEQLISRSVETVTFDELSELWECSPEEAERYFAMVKQEAQREFASGHLAAKVFEPVDWLRSVWMRAQFLAVRDSFIAEYGPEGGIEYALIDTLSVCYFMQQYWAEAAVRRTKTDPRRESIEYTDWKGDRGDRAREKRYDDGNWEIPWVTEDRAVRTTAEMVDQFSRLFQRTLRQLNNHRLAKLKARKLEAEVRRLGGKAGKDAGSNVRGGGG
jgi:hypothetical protein